MSPELVAGALRIVVEPMAANTLTVRWFGRSDDEKPRDFLVPFLTELLDQSKRDSVPLEMRFDEVEYLNSATLTSIIHFIQAARDQGVRLSVVYDESVRWQKLSFSPLRVFARRDGLISFSPRRAQMEPVTFEISLPVGAQWRNIELVRSAIVNCASVLFGEAGTDLNQAIGVAVGELMENAIKYGRWTNAGSEAITLRVSSAKASDDIVVTVANPAEAASAGVKAFFERLAWLNSHPTPQDAYDASLNELAEAGDSVSRSRLGLARILYEGNATLRAECTGGMLQVTANVRPGRREVSA